ncbi:MAG: FkbM family methyltransferase [Alphaproteobacteria bacterium]|nr:FkbM family methyltransferase [Alphaproteobacteria bacterium]
MTGPTLTLTLRDGTSIVTADNIERISTYVLLEQEDWFEDELALVRRLARPSLRMLDIGSNIGIYSLAAARAAGGDARIWAFEPTPEAGGMLRQSAALNGFTGIEVVPIALGDRTGEAVLVSDGDSELNAIAPEGDGPRIMVSRLDDFAAAAALPAIEFVKLDVEGSEAAVVAGGEAFFRDQSPLVMFEITSPQGVTMAAADRLRALGYGIYRLVVEPGALMPDEAQSYAFRLNLFACKPDRAARLAADGLLAGASRTPRPADRDEIAALVAAPPALAPASRRMRELALGLDMDDAHAAALGYYAASRRPGADADERVGALSAAFAAAEAAVAARRSLPRVMTAARVAYAWGRRERAVAHARWLVDAVLRGDRIAIDEPFVPALAAYEAWSPADGPGAWINAMALESLWRWKSFSDLFVDPTMPQGHPRDLLRKFGREAPEFERRHQLGMMFRKLASAPRAHPLLVRDGPDNRNPGYWGGVSGAA